MKWLLALLALAAAPATAQPADVARVELLPGWRTGAGTHMAALSITLAPGWKTYWRAPGDAGIPPRFDWRGSENLRGVAVHWPAPSIFTLGGYQTVGYADRVVLPLEITPSRAGAPVSLAGEVELGVCETVCVPITVGLSATLPAGGGADPRILAALAQRPDTAREAGVGSVACTVSPIADGLRLTARIDLPEIAGEEAVVVELPDPSVWVSPAETAREGGTLTGRADLVPASGAPFALDRSDVRLTVLGGGRAVEIDGCRG